MAQTNVKEGKKFTEDEMKKVSSIKEKYNEITVRFGQLKIEQRILDEQIDKVDNQYKAVRQSEIDFVKQLSEKYGAGNLDLDTGVFIPTE
jgi:ATP adenylyltransferase/5',5'''-P-1,P-4-tetraphosphate phosphorylase II